MATNYSFSPVTIAFVVCKGGSITPSESDLSETKRSRHPGLEDYALESILSEIRSGFSQNDAETEILNVSASLSSGHVLLRFPSKGPNPPTLFSECLKIYSTGKFLAVSDAFLSVYDEEIEDIRRGLENDYLHRLQITSSVRGSKKKSRKDGASESRSETSTSEVAFLSAISRLTNENHPALNIALSLCGVPHGDQGRTFRGSFYNPSHTLPFSSLSTREIETRIGELASFWLDLREQRSISPETFLWKVNLTSPSVDLNIRIITVLPQWKARSLSGNSSPPSELQSSQDSQPAFPKTLRMLLTLRLPFPPTSSPLRISLIRKGRTFLAPSTAHVLGMVHPVFSPFISTFIPDVVVLMDPCAGTGSIPFELATLARTTNVKTFVLAGEIEEYSTRAVQDSIAGISETKVHLEVFTWSAGVFGGSMRNEIIDGIITDLPYGHRELSFSAIDRLYPQFLATFARICKPHSYIVLMTASRALLKRCLEKNGSWEWNEIGRDGVKREREAFIGGLRVWVFLLKRRS